MGASEASEIPEITSSPTNATSLPEATPTPTIPPNLLENKLKVLILPSTETTLNNIKPTKTIQKLEGRKKNICAVCKKRLGFFGFDCRCGKLFCANHRYYETHNCSFDFLTPAREQLKNDNPQITSVKLAERV